MAPKDDDEWSDSDDDVLSEMETSVLLGVPDGVIDGVDINDAAVSRIGGHPAFIPSQEPSLSSASCKSCSKTMELLVQMWCPVENSPHDRVLYVWGCAQGSCQKKDGSVRAWRGLRFNEKYAVILEKKLAKKRAQERAKADAEAAKNKIAIMPNPFLMQQSSAPNPFGLGTQIFDKASAEPTTSSPEEVVEASDAESEASASSCSDESVIVAMASATIGPSPWVSAPSYQPLYLSTTSEFLPPPPKAKLRSGTQVQDPADDEGKEGKNANWTFEAYENSLEVDHIFDRFTKRVGYEGEQCVRYELKGIPLPFASDKVFDVLFPVQPQPPLPVTKAVFKVLPAQKRIYDPTSLPPCPLCKSKRVFECQLMPNLINVLRSGETETKLTDEERRKAVEKALKGGDAPDIRGMGWGTCMVFACENDCCVDDDGEFEARECWREELVMVQWDD